MSEEKVTREKGTGREVFPVLPLRDIVVFPYMIVPLYVSATLTSGSTSG